MIPYDPIWFCIFKFLVSKLQPYLKINEFPGNFWKYNLKMLEPHRKNTPSPDHSFYSSLSIELKLVHGHYETLCILALRTYHNHDPTHL